MTQENLVIEKTKEQVWYTKLDRFLLYLLATELGYFVLLILVGVLLAVVNFFSDIRLDFFMGGYASSILWPVFFYILALPLNMLGGLASIMLSIRTNHEGYPGTGHLLNWIFLMTTGWLFILAIVFLFQPIASSY